MKSIYPILFLLGINSIVSYGQPGYSAGTSTVSIEPDNATFSLALAGYGAPREGRFSITWNEIGDIGKIMAVTALNGKLYAVKDDNKLYSGKEVHGKIIWKELQEAGPVTCLAALHGKLYAVKNEKLWAGSFSNGKIKWSPLSGKANISTLTTLNNKFFATNSRNELITGTLLGKSITWKKTRTINGITGLTSHRGKLIAVNSGDTLWTIKPGSASPVWKEIGRNNGITFSIHIKHIVANGDILYAVSSDDKIFRASHKTDGNLSVRSLAIKNKDKTVVITGMDVTGINLSLINEIKNFIFKARKIPPSAILINASHTHYAPVTQAWTTWADFYQEPDSSYLNNIVKRAVVKSIEKALDNMAPAELYLGRGYSGIGLNRRSSINNDKPYDSTLDVLKIVSPDKKIKSVLFLTACHPVFRNAGAEAYTLSANYPGVARKIIEEKVHIPHSIFIQGCGGDINPKSDQHVETGRQLAADVLKLLETDMQPLKGDISFALDKIEIPITPWSKDSVLAFRNTNAAKPGDLSAEKNVRWANLMLNRYANGTVASSLPEYVQTINIGNWKLVGLSREAVNEYGPAIRNLWPEKKVTVAGYCNDVASYLPIAWHIIEKQYEGYDSFLWYGQPGIPPLNVLDIIVQQIKKFNR